MDNEYLPLLALAVTVLVANWTMFRGLRTEFQDLRTELKADIHRLEDKIEDKVDGLRKELKADIQDLQQAQHGLNERMARIEGPVQGLQEPIVARSAACMPGSFNPCFTLAAEPERTRAAA